jgi:RNA polymerase sigma-70 factor (ECF subfamily)
MVERVTHLDSWRSDDALVLAARAGDRGAKETLFTRHARTAMDRAYRLLGHDGELEDVVQESFAYAFASLSKLAEPQAFAAWLGTIVTGTAIACIRRRRFLARIGLAHLEPAQLERIVSPGAPADVVTELRSVYGVINTFPAAERAVLVLRKIEQLTLEEIAEQTGLSLATVKRKLARAERRLHDETSRGRDS